ncbi:MAG: DUF5703 domain-containing protein [Verrucomicrobiota bacterium]
MRLLRNGIARLLAILLMIPSLVGAADYAAMVEDIRDQQPAFDPVLSETYTVEWTTQSSDASQSMPVGGGDIGLNVWVEDNSLLFYISKSDTIDENNVFGKLGRVKVSLDPCPFAESTSFSQKLLLKEGHCEIKAVGKDGNEVEIKVWVDVFKSVIHVEVDSEKPLTAVAEYHTWRFEDMQLPFFRHFSESNDYGSLSKNPEFAKPYTLYADVTELKDDRVVFFHKNNNEDLTMHKAIDEVGLRDDIDLETWHDPATDFTFGGVLWGKGMVGKGDFAEGRYMDRDYLAYSLVSKEPATSQAIHVALHTGQYETAAGWEAALKETGKRVSSKEDRAKTVAWWQGVWNRSHIMINSEDPAAHGHDIARNYQLFRYMLACNAFGVHPTKFNGGMFTWGESGTDADGKTIGNPDFRQWGPGLTLQNQRHMYWPMLRSGDHDMMAPMFNYFRDTYRNTEQLVKSAFGHPGAMYSEYFNFYGLPSLGNEYWLDPRNYADGSELEKGVMGANLVRFEHVHQLDFSFMMLEQQRYFGTDISEYVSFIESSLEFFLEHYKYRYKRYTREYEGSGVEDEDGLDENGHLVIYPSTSGETYKNTLNPTDIIVALNCVLEDLIRVHGEKPAVYGDIEVEKWKEMLTRIPPVNLGGVNKNGDPIFLPGDKPGEMGEKSPYYQSGTYTEPYNIEPCQLSVVFPYNVVSQGRPEAQRAINTTETELEAFNGGMKSHLSWSYYNLLVTRLGLVDQARTYAQLKLGNGPYRFPSFWGPGHDYSPDHNWGGSGIYGLQEMALQSYDDVIVPFATWPEDWKGSFKLHAPEKTLVEGYTMKDGRKASIITVDAKSSREMIALQGDEVGDFEVFTSNGAVELTIDEEKQTAAFKVEAGSSYYIIDPS